MNRLQKLAGINELGIGNSNINILPKKNWELKSEQYKRFYQLITICGYWNVDWNDDYEVNFDENWNDFYFFTFLYSTSSVSNLLPNKFIITFDSLCEAISNYSITYGYCEYVFDKDEEYKDEAIKALPYIKKILNKLKEHSQ